MINSVITISGYQLSDKQTINVSTLDQLIALRDRINQVIVENGQPEDTGKYISAILARKIATARGVQMHDNTLISACQRGLISSARKNGGRWEFLASDFDSYLRRFAQHRIGQHREPDYELMRMRLKEAREVEDISFIESQADEFS